MMPTLRVAGGGVTGRFREEFNRLDNTQRMADFMSRNEEEEMRLEREAEERRREEEEQARDGFFNPYARRDDVDERAMRILSYGKSGGGSSSANRRRAAGEEGNDSVAAMPSGPAPYHEPSWGATPVRGAMQAELSECEAGRVLRVIDLNEQSCHKVHPVSA